MRFIGDVHGYFDHYSRIAQIAEESVQVGDMGVGFGITFPSMPSSHRFIRGNHDNPKECRNIPNYIDDGHTENNMMFIGGALSIDKQWRVEGKSWWPDEELTTNQLQVIIDKYLDEKPSVVVSHECPESVALTVFPFYDQRWPSRTRQAFDVMFKQHQPDLWVFGHWHYGVDRYIHNTRFICLDELECIDVKL